MPGNAPAKPQPEPQPESGPTPDHRPPRRVNAIGWCLGGFLACNLVAGWLGWRQWLSAESVWIFQLLSIPVMGLLVAALFARHRRTPVEPIRSIAAWASRIRQGDFSARLEGARLEDDGELRALTDDINRLAEWLESLAELKNRELLEQGARLKTQTHIMRLLYDISGHFSHNADHNVTANELLERTIGPMAEVLEARRIEFFRFEGEGEEEAPVRVAAWDGGGDDEVSDSTADECVKIPLRLSRDVRGECQIRFAAERFPLPDEFSQLLYTLGRNIGMALERIDLHEESARLSRMRERTHLANELHDSLAQTIAGLRFQVRVLDDLLHQQEEHAAWRQLETVENLVEEANAELRSLIGYFRGPGDPGDSGDLQPAIQAAVARFRRESEIPMFFQEQWGEVVIPERWQLEIVRIIQEALSNIRRHSRAKNARVLLRRDEGDGNDGDKKYTALVEDDGIGTAVTTDAEDDADPETPGEHIGLSVMAQRAKSINAEFHVDSEPGEGTRILLSFRLP